MNIEGFIEIIEEEFEDIEQGILKPESDFKKELEWSSVNALIMITLVNTEFDIIINANDINNSKTIQELYDLVLSKIEN